MRILNVSVSMLNVDIEMYPAIVEVFTDVGSVSFHFSEDGSDWLDGDVLIVSGCLVDYEKCWKAARAKVRFLYFEYCKVAYGFVLFDGVEYALDQLPYFDGRQWVCSAVDDSGESYGVYWVGHPFFCKNGAGSIASKKA